MDHASNLFQLLYSSAPTHGLMIVSGKRHIFSSCCSIISQMSVSQSSAAQKIIEHVVHRISFVPKAVDLEVPIALFVINSTESCLFLTWKKYSWNSIRNLPPQQYIWQCLFRSPGLFFKQPSNWIHFAYHCTSIQVFYIKGKYTCTMAVWSLHTISFNLIVPHYHGAKKKKSPQRIWGSSRKALKFIFTVFYIMREGEGGGKERDFNLYFNLLIWARQDIFVSTMPFCVFLTFSFKNRILQAFLEAWFLK